MNGGILPPVVTAAAVLLAAVVFHHRATLVEMLRPSPWLIAGSWKGRIVYGLDPVEVRAITCVFKQRGRHISGTLSSLGINPARYRVEGSIFGTSFLQITITNGDPSSTTCASAVLRTDSSYKSMEGHFVGKARIADEIVAGKLEIFKQ